MGVGNSLNISQSGFVAFDGISVFTGRTLTAGTGISITNPNGIVGNPTISCTVTGTVTSVSGTANRITVTNPTTTPQIDISSSYVGQNSITTLGTISSGTWNGTVVEVAYGGTGANNTPTSGTLLRGNGTAFVPTTATYPSAAGSSGNVLTSDGTNWTSSTPTSGTITTLNWSLTNAQIKALHATPVELVAAPGSGKAIVVTKSVVKLTYGGTNAFTAGGGAQVEYYYGTSHTSGVAMGNASIIATANRWNFLNGKAEGTVTTTPENLALNLYNASVTEIAGNAANNNLISGSLSYFIATI